jgi:hypothetical protein
MQTKTATKVASLSEMNIEYGVAEILSQMQVIARSNNVKLIRPKCIKCTTEEEQSKRFITLTHS